ncbi:MAG: hypothetical protein ACYS9Y_13435, partial [Planctomycetota bacterium]
EAESDTYHGSGDADASITVVAQNVYLYGGSGTTEIEVDADTRYDSGTATGTIDITTTSSDVVVDGEGADIEIDASTNYDSGDAEATITINAENVTVTNDGDISADADTDNRSGDATATVDIDASGTVDVEAGEIRAETDVDNSGGPESSSSSATSFVEIDAASDVIVGENSTIEADADVDNYDNEQINTFTGNADADVDITALGEVIVDGLVKAEADVYNRDGLELIREEGSFDGDLYQGNSSANVTINNILGLGVTVGADGEIIADSAFINWDYPDSRLEDNVYSGIALAGIDIQTCGDVIVDGLVRAKAFLDPYGTWDAVPMNDEYSQTMTADVIIKAFGDVIVNRPLELPEGEQIEIMSPSNGRIEALASNGYENSADVILLAASDVIVNNETFPEGQVEVLAEASGGHINDAHIGIATRDGVGEGDVIVGGQIKARTYDAGESYIQYIPENAPSNTSSIEISAARDVIVEGGYAEFGESEGLRLADSEEGGLILAAAGNGYANNNRADVDVLAVRDIIVEAAEVEFTEDMFKPIGDEDALGGQIMARTHDGFENTSTVQLFAQRDVTIEGADTSAVPEYDDDFALGGQVLAQSRNGFSNSSEVGLYAYHDVTIDGLVKAGAQNGEEDSSVVKVKALNQIAGTGEIYAIGSSIIFDTPADNFAGNSNIDPVDGDLDFPVMEFEWLDWTWCVDCEDAPIQLAAPLDVLQAPQTSGCPAAMGAVASELAIAEETLQISIGNMLALNPSIQPCNACTGLLNAAAILRDEDGSRMAALVQVFNEQAPANVPFSPAMAASIVTAFADPMNGGSQSNYAAAMEYIDAFVQYVAILDTGLGSPVGDSTAFVLAKYGAGITESENTNIGAFMMMNLGSI